VSDIATAQAMQAPVAGYSRWLNRAGWAVVFAVLAVTILYPIFWALAGSFQTDEGAWTLAQYARVFSPFYLRVMATTVVYAAGSSALALALALPVAWAVARTDVPGSHAIRACVTITFVMPPLFHALAFVFLFQPQAGLVNNVFARLFGVRPFNIYTLTGLVVVTAIGLSPQAFLLVESALRAVDPSLEEAAAVTGATHLQVVRRIVLPVVLPAILSSLVLGMIEGLGIFGPPAVIGIPAKIFVISTQIFIGLSGSPPRIEFCAALAILFLATSLLLLVAQDRLLRRRSFVTITGRGFRPRQVQLGRWRWPVAGYIGAMLAIGLVIPTSILVVVSVSKVWTAGLVPSNLTLDYYRAALLGQERTFQSLANTLVLALVTLAGTLVIGLPVAWMITRKHGWLARSLRFIVYLPLAVPAIVFTVGVVLAFIRPPLVLYGTLAIIAVCYFARFLPFAVQPLSDGLRQIDASLTEAARVVGSGAVRTGVRIVLPLLKYSAVSTAMLVFVACAREIVSIALLYSPGTETMMITALLLWEEGQSQITAAMVVFVLVLVAAFYGAVRFSARRRGF
jgi:iron(III) transport system permease protein